METKEFTKKERINYLKKCLKGIKKTPASNFGWTSSDFKYIVFHLDGDWEYSFDYYFNRIESGVLVSDLFFYEINHNYKLTKKEIINALEEELQEVEAIE